MDEQPKPDVDERYDDGGFTGANTDRPAFQRLMADIDAGKVDVIVVYKVDRLSRSLLDFVKVMERLGTADASFVSVTQNFSTADAMGRLTMNLLASFAEFERSMIAERTRDKIAASRRKGKWTGGPVPFGYSAKDKKLVVNEVEARVVREAFALFLQHRQMAKVARELNERGLLPRGSSRPSRLGLRWTKDSVARVLRSPPYAGLTTYGDELHPGEQPRIIDDATYRQATRILEDERRELRFTGLNPDYVLRGLLRCAGCGQAMCPGSTSKNGKTYRFYRCSTRDKHGKDACPARPLPARALEELVAERITAATADVKLVQHIERSLRARIEAQRASLAAIRADLPGRVASAPPEAKRPERAVVSAVAGGLSDAVVFGAQHDSTCASAASPSQQSAPRPSASPGAARFTTWPTSPRQQRPCGFFRSQSSRPALHSALMDAWIVDAPFCATSASMSATECSKQKHTRRCGSSLLWKGTPRVWPRTTTSPSRKYTTSHDSEVHRRQPSCSAS